MKNDQNKKKYKALMLDVDGTLVVNHREALPTQRVAEAISKAKDKIHIGIATGRPLYQVSYLFDVLSLSGPCIITSGTQIIDAASKKILKQQSINTADVFPVITVAKELNIIFDVVEEDHDVLYFDGYEIKNPLGLYTKPIDEPLADIFIQSINHISTISAHKTSSWVQNKVQVTVNHAEATKQYGIYEVAKILGIETHEIIGVGDAYNDFPLLMACGLKVAMGNAIEDLKAIADYIAPTVEEDGVVDVIEKFIL